MRATPTLAAAAFGWLCVVACEREARPFDRLSAATAEKAVLSPLSPGGAGRPLESGTSPFQNNAWGIAEGKRLFEAYNCVGCHAHGGGGMGPALMDDKWIYGDRAANLFETIVEGRPNGMPAFRGKVPDAQVWQLVAYVQSMSGHAAMDALPGRNDDMSQGPAENARRARTPVQTGTP